MAVQYQITYGNVSFVYKRLQVAASLIFAEDQATVIGTNYNFTVDAWLYSSLGPGGELILKPTLPIPTDSVAGTWSFNEYLTIIKANLDTPRLPFVVQWDDGSGPQKFYDFSNQNDINYGPKPKNVAITQFAGGRIARVNFQLDVQTKECKGVPESLPYGILAITQSQGISLDVDGLTTRRISGNVYVTAQSVQNNRTADSYRNVVPAPPKGFQRQSQQFSTTPDGRIMSYSVVDTEYNWNLPSPITGGDMNWAVRTSGLGSVANCTLSGEFSAPKDILKSSILDVIITIIAGKFSSLASALPANAAVIPGEMEFVEGKIFHRNSISFTVTARVAQYSPNSSSISIAMQEDAFWSGAIAGIGDKPAGTSDDGTSYYPNPYGTAGNSLIAVPPKIFCCGSSLSSYQASPSSPGTPDGSQRDYGSSDYGDKGDDNPSKVNNGGLSQAMLTSPWLEYVEQTRWVFTNFIATMPSKNPQSVGAVVFQTAAPIITVLQTGYQRQAILQTNRNDAPHPPDPLYLPPAAIMLDSWVEAQTGDVVGPGPYVIYTMRYFYKMRLTQALPNTTYPLDLRYQNTDNPSQLPAFNIPEGLSVTPNT